MPNLLVSFFLAVSLAPGSGVPTDPEGRRYFPTEAFRSPYTTENLRQEWYGRVLRAAGEPSLFASTRYRQRFIWLRSFHDPIIITWEPTSEGADLRFVRLSSADSYPDAGFEVEERRSVRIDEREAAIIEDMMTNLDICRAPPDEALGCDGAQWIFEVRHEDYCVADRWSGFGNFSDVGRYLLEVAGFEANDDDPIY